MNFVGKTVIITGAGRGIGLETARHLAAQGAQIVGIARTQADLDALAAETGARTIAAELGDPAQARRAAKDALPADLLVNCAGMNILEPFLEMTDEAFDRVYAVNTRAAYIVAQEYARARIAAGGGGAIVNVSSMSALVGFADHAAYCASKAGLDGLSRVMANELGPHGIRVNCINPTVTWTDLAAEAWSDPAKSEPMLARIPLGRFAETGDIASIIAFLLSDASAFLNGTSIPVDGGLLTR